MGIHPVGCEEPPRTRTPDHPSERSTGPQAGSETAVGQAEIFPPGDAEDGRRRGRLAGPDLNRSPGGGLAVGQVEDAHRHALCEHEGDRASHAEFRVVGVGGDHQGIEHERLLERARG